MTQPIPRPIFGVILDVDPIDGTVEFAPITTDLDCTDSYTTIIAADANPLGRDLAAFAGLTTPIPITALGQRVGVLDEQTTLALHTLWRENLAGTAPSDPSRCPTGALDTVGCSPGQAYRTALRRRLVTVQMTDFDARSDAQSRK